MKTHIHIFTLLLSLLIPNGQSTFAQDAPTLVIIQLREADGSPTVAEDITLQQMDSSIATFSPISPSCQTDNAGICQWHLSHGLYQLQFNRPLDPFSNIAIGEGGLTGFGITVGTTPITYHFTFQGDGFVYFDTTPENPIPSPFIPKPDHLHVLSTPTLAINPTATMAMPPFVTISDPPQATARQNRWHIWIYIGIGAGIGIGWHLYNQRKKREVTPHA